MNPRKAPAKPDVVFSRCDDGGFVAECLAIPGCISQGDTLEEATANIADAIAACKAVLAEGAIPAPHLRPRLDPCWDDYAVWEGPAIR